MSMVFSLLLVFSQTNSLGSETLILYDITFYARNLVFPAFASVSEAVDVRPPVEAIKIPLLRCVWKSSIIAAEFIVRGGNSQAHKSKMQAKSVRETTKIRPSSHRANRLAHVLCSTSENMRSEQGKELQWYIQHAFRGNLQ